MNAVSQRWLAILAVPLCLLLAAAARADEAEDAKLFQKVMNRPSEREPEHSWLAL